MNNKVWEKYEDIDAAIYEKEQQINNIHLNWDKLVNQSSEEKVLQALDEMQEEKEELIKSACSFLSNRNTTLMREGTKAKKEIKAHQKIQNEKNNKVVDVANKENAIEKVTEDKATQKQRLKKEQILLEIKRKILAKEISLDEASRLVHKVAAIYGKAEEKEQPKSMKKVA